MRRRTDNHHTDTLRSALWQSHRIPSVYSMEPLPSTLSREEISIEQLTLRVVADDRESNPVRQESPLRWDVHMHPFWT